MRLARLRCSRRGISDELKAVAEPSKKEFFFHEKGKRSGGKYTGKVIQMHADLTELEVSANRLQAVVWTVADSLKVKLPMHKVRVKVGEENGRAKWGHREVPLLPSSYTSKQVCS